nr:alpha carbonic anhydrase 7-like [Ipomoea batatas]
MRKQSVSATLILASLLCFFLFLHAATAQEVEDEREFEYDEDSDKGPSKWGDIKKEWAACKNGKLQSPIDLSHERVRIFQKVEKKSYIPANATVKNRGHDISIEWHGDAGSILINGTEYSLKAAHWHSPSEHTIHGRRYALELHMLHMNTDKQTGQNKTAVIAVLYKIGKPNAFLSKLMTNITSMIDQEDVERNLGFVDPNEIKFITKKYYRYVGSLTTPPCTEGVIWTVNKKIKTVSKRQVKLLREAVHDFAERNSRPLQQRNSRKIYLRLPAGSSK